MITQPANLLSFLGELKEAHIHYHLGHYRDDAITAEVSVPGERWEVEFLKTDPSKSKYSEAMGQSMIQDYLLN